jgi:hypothetical protein
MKTFKVRAFRRIILTKYHKGAVRLKNKPRKSRWGGDPWGAADWPLKGLDEAIGLDPVAPFYLVKPVIQPRRFLVPAIALDPKNQTLHRPKKPKDFLVHYQPLAARFRSLILIQSTLKADHPDLCQKFTPDQERSLGPKTQWNVQL